MYKYYSRTLKDKEFKEVDVPRPGVWILADKPGESARDELVKKHHLDSTILHDATDFFEVPRVEREDEIVYFFARYPVQTPDGEMSTAPILVALGPSFVLTNTLTNPDFIKDLIKKNGDVYTTQRTKLFLHILRAITNEYTKSFIAVRKEVRKHFGHFSSINDSDIERFVALESTMNDYISALIPTQAALKQTLSKDFIDFHESDEDLMEDLAIAHGQLVEGAKSLSKTIQNIRNAYSTIVASKLNRMMKKLTALTIILTVPMIITSFYGMNISLPFDKSPVAFVFVIIMMIISAGAVGYYFAKNNWL